VWNKCPLNHSRKTSLLPTKEKMEGIIPGASELDFLPNLGCKIIITIIIIIISSSSSSSEDYSCREKLTAVKLSAF
jgi:hypothetical protein